MPRSPGGVRPRVKDAREYERDLRQFLDPLFRRMEAQVSQASTAGEAWVLAEQTAIDLPRIESVARSVLGKVETYHRARMTATFRSALGVNISPFLSEAPVRAYFQAKIAENVDLVQSIHRNLHTNLQRKITEVFAEAPFDQQRLAQMLQKEYKINGYNLRRMTRDQTNKMIGQLSEYRQKEIAIAQYRWITAEDERVRPTHVANGAGPDNIFAWAKPPDATGHPGSDVQCRCYAEPIVTRENARRLGAKT